MASYAVKKRTDGNHLTALLSRSDQSMTLAGSSNQYSFKSGINSYSIMDDKV